MTAPVAATVRVPGSKSLANRALVLAALADGPARVTNLPAGSRDLALMLAAISATGATVSADTATSVTVHPGRLATPARVDCGLAGTVMRFVPPMAALQSQPVAFDGDERARERPMGPMIAALRALGIEVTDADAGRLPFVVHGRGAVPGGPVTIDASASSQFVTALLLSGARFDEGVTVHHQGAPVPSLPHIDMTVRMLGEQGVTVTADTTDRGAASWTVAPGALRARDRAVEPDLSNALPFAMLALVTGGRVVVTDWPEPSLQPSPLPLLERLGARVERVPAGLAISGDGTVQGIDVDLRDLGELVPSVVAACVFADSPSRLAGIGHIAGHETDRLAALAAGVNALGGRVTAQPDGLRIEPAVLHGGRWPTHHDHRMATCGAIIGARVPGVLIENVATTAKTFPGFVDTWMRATGEGTP